MTESGVRPGAVAVVFAVALTGIGVALYAWWPAGVVLGLVFGVVATVVIGRRMQDAAAAVPTDDDLLALLGGTPAGESARVTRTTWSKDDVARSRRTASVR